MRIFHPDLSSLAGSGVSLINSLEKAEWKMAWDDLQTDLACCGAAGYEDWAKHNYTGAGVPDSCCKVPTSSFSMSHSSQRNCLVENIRQEVYEKIGVRYRQTDSFEYQFCSSLAA